MTDRPLFDPSRIRVPPEERLPGTGGPATVTVRQVNDLVRGAINRHVPSTLHVVGELGDVSHAASGHLYFTLKDADSELRCVMWRSSAQKLRFQVGVGMAVIATGGIEVYSPRGTYQLIVRALEPRGVGALELAFRQLKEKLEREGLFDARRKRPLPRIPERIALITSPTGAAIRDILHTLNRRYPALDILVFPVRVQGEGSAAEIAAAIRLMNEHADRLGGIDLAIVGRGGGSLEDLWAFNEEIVARAIVSSRTPIVSAVGHEVDVSISDLVADLRAPTPTAAAELITPRMTDLIEWAERQRGRVQRVMAVELGTARQRLDRCMASETLARPADRLQRHVQRVDEWTARIGLMISERLRGCRAQLTRHELAALRFGSGAQFARTGRRLEERMSRLRRAMDGLLHRQERCLSARSARLERALPLARLGRHGEHLAQAGQRLAGGLRQSLAHWRQMLVTKLAAVQACDPKRVLQRGFSITRDAKTRAIIRSVSEVRDGRRIVTELADGEFRSTAEDPRQGGLFE